MQMLVSRRPSSSFTLWSNLLWQKLKVWKPGCSTIKQIYFTQCLHISERQKEPRHWAQRVALPSGIATSRSALYSCEAQMLKTRRLWEDLSIDRQAQKKKRPGQWVEVTIELSPLHMFQASRVHWITLTDGPNNPCLQIEHVCLLTFTQVSKNRNSG